MKLFGYIDFVDTNTNVTDKVVIRCCNYNVNYDFCGDDACTEYVFNKISKMMLSRSVSDKAQLSYIKAAELLDAALDFDKKNPYNIQVEFKFDTEGNDKPEFKVKRIVKEVFPLPKKNITYMPVKTYINITEHVADMPVLSRLEASVYADHYNTVAVLSGFRSDNFFDHSCGRVLMLADDWLSSVNGRNFIKHILPDKYLAIRNCCKGKLTSINIPRSDFVGQNFDNDNYSNVFLKAHCLVSKQLSAYSLLTVLKQPDIVKNLVDKQMQIYNLEFQREYYQSLVEKTSDYSYLSIRDLLMMHINPDFRINLKKHVAVERKIYNANKDRKSFVCVMSDGKLI